MKERTDIMRSTDHNLNNPMEVKTLNIYPSVDCTKLSEIVKLTMEEYELIQIKDPTIIYVITDSKDNKIYYGDILVAHGETERIYLLGPANKFGEYTLYLNETDGHTDRLIQICRYSDPQVAIDSLNKFNRVGSHHAKNLQTHIIISEYIIGDISIHDMLIGIISLFGYRDSIRLQSLVNVLKTYDINAGCKDLPILLKKDLRQLKTIYDNQPIFGFYSDLYDLVSYYNFFKGRDFQKDTEDLDLSKVIAQVFVIMENK